MEIVVLLGIKLKSSPTDKQKKILNQWMGAAKCIWNAKCQEDRYFTIFARKYYPINTYPPVDQTYSQFKDKELSPWLYEVPSQILRNSATNWYNTYRDFIKGKCGKPKIKHNKNHGSMHLTREFFKFVKCDDGVTRLYIGTSKKFNVGYLTLKLHRKFKIPNSIYIKRSYNEYHVAFCYDDGQDIAASYHQDNLKYLNNAKQDFLDKYTIGIDRGIARPVQCSDNKYFELTAEQKRSKNNKLIKIKRYQRRMARQQKNSKRQLKIKYKISKAHKKIKNMRNDFCHKTSHKITSNTNNKIIILEDLNTKSMSKRSKPKQDKNGKWLKNNAAAKSGLNKSILDQGWNLLEQFILYKCLKFGKAFFKVSAKFTSQECANCGYTHPSNRTSQSKFECMSCGNKDNADLNAAEVIKQRAIKLILYSGTELSNKLVLLDPGRGAKCKTLAAHNAVSADGNEASKKKKIHTSYLDAIDSRKLAALAV
jgi:putative transposase